MNETVDANLVEFVDPVGRNGIEGTLDEPLHALLYRGENRLSRGIGQEGE